MSQLATGTTSGLRLKARTNSNVVCTRPKPRIRNHKASLLVHLCDVGGLVSGAGNEPWMSIQ